MDKRVEIHGTKRADMNGKLGVAIDFSFGPNFSIDGSRIQTSTAMFRYTVELDSGEAFKVKRENVRAERTGGGSGAGKAKGKGKKGKKGRGGRS